MSPRLSAKERLKRLEDTAAAEPNSTLALTLLADHFIERRLWPAALQVIDSAPASSPELLAKKWNVLLRSGEYGRIRSEFWNDPKYEKHPHESARVVAAAEFLDQGPEAGLAALDRLEQGRFDEDTEWLARYLAFASSSGRQEGPMREFPRARPQAAAGQRTLAILDYKSPEFQRSSQNLGDMIQSESLLRLLAWFGADQWSTNEPGVRSSLRFWERSWESTAEVSGADLHIAIFDRDVPRLDRYDSEDPDTWAIVYGWHFHRQFGEGSPFPYPANWKPVFLSFYLADATVLQQPEVIAWLRSSGPVGCRDWHTVNLLLSAGVPAFFTGCLTSTLRWPTAAPDRSGGAILIEPAEVAKDDATAVLSQLDPEMRARPFEANHLAAIGRLDRIRGAASIDTGRLHAYLPARAFGTPVTFSPANEADARYEGLTDISDEEFFTMRSDLTELVIEVLTRMRSSGRYEDFRTWWRTRNQVAVAYAENRLAQHQRPWHRESSASPLGTPRSWSIVLGGSSSPLRFTFPTIRSIRDCWPAAPIRIAGLSKDQIPGLLHRTATEFGEDVHCVAVGSGSGSTPVSSAIEDSDEEAVIYIGSASTVLVDLQELISSLPPCNVAARRAADSRHPTVKSRLEQIARRLRPDAAKKVRWAAAANCDLTAPAIETGLLVVRPEHWRSDVAPVVRELVERFGADEDLAINIAVAETCEEIDPAWLRQPYLEFAEDAKILHWPSGPRPWHKDRNTLRAEAWLSFVR